MLLVNYKGNINKSGDTFVVNDITGEDNIASSTKYATNSTNPNHPKTDNSITEFIVTLPDGTVLPKIVYNLLINSVTPNIAATSQVPIPYSAFTINFTAADLGLTNTLFTDGMYRFDTTIWMKVTNGDSVVLASDLKSLSGTGTVFDSAKYGLADAKYIKIIKNSDSTKNVNTTINQVFDATDLVLDDALSATDFTSGDIITIFAGYRITFYIKANINLLNCFLPKVAKRSVAKRKCCKTCGQSEMDILDQIYLGMFDIEAQIDVGMFDIANKNILALGKICKNLGCDSHC